MLVRLIVMGSGPFAVPTFQALLDSDHSILALVTRPPRTAPGRRKKPVNPMRQVADQHSLPVLEPDNVNAHQSQQELLALASDLMVVCDYGQILKARTLATARLGGINLHASLLPKYRGAAPIQWAIFHGESETGVTVIHMTPQLDAGPCVAQHRVAIDPDESAVELEQRLAVLGTDVVCSVIDELEVHQAVAGQAQDEVQASLAPRLKKTDGQVDWSRTADQIRNQVRAMKPWPATYTQWLRPGPEPLRIILDDVAVRDDPTESAIAGTVVSADKRHVWVATGDGQLSLQRVQPSGRRVMSIDQFLAGHPLRAGDRFG